MIHTVEGLKFALSGTEVKRLLKIRADDYRRWYANLESDIIETPVEPPPAEPMPSMPPGFLAAVIGGPPPHQHTRAEGLRVAKQMAEVIDAMHHGIIDDWTYLLQMDDLANLHKRVDVRECCISPLKQ